MVAWHWCLKLFSMAKPTEYVHPLGAFPIKTLTTVISLLQRRSHKDTYLHPGYAGRFPLSRCVGPAEWDMVLPASASDKVQVASESTRKGHGLVGSTIKKHKLLGRAGKHPAGYQYTCL